jgi:hypothetical protein
MLHEFHYSDTPDISMYRFKFWHPVWYYAPKQSFPKSKMLCGWLFLGVAKNIGDAFCFLVLSDPEHTKPEDTKKPQQVIARTVVQ